MIDLLTDLELCKVGTLGSYHPVVVNQLTFYFIDSNKCKRKRCSTAPTVSSTNKSPLHTGDFSADFDSRISIHKHAINCVLFFGDSLFDCSNKPHGQRPYSCFGEVLRYFGI